MLDPEKLDNIPLDILVKERNRAGVIAQKHRTAAKRAEGILKALNLEIYRRRDKEHERNRTRRGVGADVRSGLLDRKADSGNQAGSLDES